MAAVHMATMTFARRLAHVETIAQQDSAERGFNKLSRTFAVQLEALKRYRSGVQHVTVNEGGQAIVGSVSPQVGGVGDARKKLGTAPCIAYRTGGLRCRWRNPARDAALGPVAA